MPAGECCCSLRGPVLPLETAVETLDLNDGEWRHSAATLEIWRCKRNGAWSPCFGGSDAGEDGDGCEQCGIRMHASSQA
eukprot:5835962-Prymnesium_polylepis.3